jgi:branched-chain amino acid transport system ATP-binding protein
MNAPLLELRDLVKRFGALVVTDRVSLAVMPGEIHALIGPNGAGKSCLVGQISGELASDEGEVRFRGHRLNGLSVQARARLGLARAYQIPQLFSNQSALGNVRIAEIARTRTGFQFWGQAARDPRLQSAAQGALERVGLDAHSAQSAMTLAHGQKRLLELAMGFAAEPALLLLDEPLAGLGPAESQAMVALLRSLRGRYGMLLIEHDVQAVFALADRISVLVGGRLIATGTADQIRVDSRVRSAYLGQAG